MRKKEEKISLPVKAVDQPVVKRRGRPAKKAVAENQCAASEAVLMAVYDAEDKLRQIQRKYDDASKELTRVQREHEKMLKKCENIKLLLASYYNLEEKGTDKLLVPEKKTPYWYIRATFAKDYFDVCQCEWIGGMSDKFRYCRGNFFLDEQTANMVCASCNALMARI